MTLEQALCASGIEPREARLLLAHVTGWTEAAVLGFPERSLARQAQAQFMESVARRRRGEPIAYILGYKEFHALRLAVTPAVLIPRPETELLVDLALEREFAALADLGTGSGAIALAVKAQRPQARVVAVDASTAALEIAQRNAAASGLKVEWRHGRWLEPLAGERFDLIVANPPYVAEQDPHLADLRFEPQEALVSGVDGLDAIREIIATAPRCLHDHGWLMLEHGLGQDGQVRRLLGQAGLEAVQSWPDLAGIPRVSGGRR